MTCIFCKGSMVSGTTTNFRDLAKCIVIIKSVPCLVCDQCGQTVYTGAVARQLETMTKALKDSFAEVAIVQYSDQVA